MTEQGYRDFYRIVKNNPPTRQDLRSAKEKGQDPPTDPVRLAVWDGLSVFSTLAQARRRRRTSPGLGSYIAVLRVPTDGSVRFERTLGGDGHHTLWGGAALLQSFVVSVEPVYEVH